MHSSFEQQVGKNKGKRGHLAIPALLNDVSIHPLAQKTTLADNYFNNDYSPISSGSSSPSDCSSVITEPPDLWNHSRTGMHQTNTGKMIISSLSKAKRKRILPYQYNRLMEIFYSTDTPSSEVREKLADELGMTKREVQVWFQNRRAKVNRSSYKSPCLVLQRNSSSYIPYDGPIRSLNNTPEAQSSPHNAIDMLAYVAEMMRET